MLVAGESVRWLFSCSNLASARRWLDVLRNEGCVMSDFSQKFRLTEILGNGGASTVFHGEVLPTAKLGSGVSRCPLFFLLSANGAEMIADIGSMLSISE